MALLSEQLTTRLANELTGTGPEVTLHEPFTGDTLVTLRTSTADDVAIAFAKARAAQVSWAALPLAERAKIFTRYHDLILSNWGVVDIIQAENGKSRNSAFEETLDVAGMSLYYARNAKKFLAPRSRPGALPFATTATEVRQPKGVIGLISPFNYPLSLSVGDLLPALVAGNAVVLKPDTQVVLTALRARELMIEAGLPADLWQIVVGEPDVVGEALLEQADHITFTGSTAAGRRIAEAAGRRLIGCTLELGGKNPMIVLDDADIDKAVKGAVRACFSTTGQLCLSIERLYVHEKVYEQFMDKLVAQTLEIKLGNGLDYSYDVGTLSLWASSGSGPNKSWPDTGATRKRPVKPSHLKVGCGPVMRGTSMPMVMCSSLIG